MFLLTQWQLLIIPLKYIKRQIGSQINSYICASYVNIIVR